MDLWNIWLENKCPWMHT